MRFCLRCDNCPASCWVHGTDEADTNTVALNDDEEWHWTYSPIDCDHENFTIVESEDDEPFDDDVI